MPEQESGIIRFLYGTALGRLCLKGLVRPGFSQFVGRFLDSGLSRCLIGGYIRRNRVPMESYVSERYPSFNAFFMRRRRQDALDIDQTPTHLISPCDGLLRVYAIGADCAFRVKHSTYTVAELLGDRLLAQRYRGGQCLVFRLTPKHYHHYCYVDDGRRGDSCAIPGVLHCVRPIACAQTPVYVQNSRAYTVLDTEHFGCVTQVEVGALLVGKICNEPGRGKIVRGQEKGHFEFGGSTVILLLPPDSAKLHSVVLEQSERGLEVPVRMGQPIGTAIGGGGAV